MSSADTLMIALGTGLAKYALPCTSSAMPSTAAWSSNHCDVDTELAVQNSAFGVNHATGHIKAYPDGGDGTVTDAATGLMWAQEDSAEGLDWESALAWAATAHEENYLGYSDWRVPDVKELQIIVDYSGAYPAIDNDLFMITDVDSYFWSSTSAYFSPEDPGYYYDWYVAFGYAVDGEGNDTHGAGAVRFDTKAEGGPAGEEPERIFNHVRLVRDV